MVALSAITYTHCIGVEGFGPEEGGQAGGGKGEEVDVTH